MEKKKRINPSAFRNMIVTIFIILFFMGAVFAYYGMLRTETKAHIIKNGEFNAANTAARIDRYLSSGIDAIRLAGYTLDNMLLDERPQSDILTYLIDQSFAMGLVVEGHVNGVYGYINGEYVDGSLWEPEDDYVPTQRPWYIEAMGHAGKVVVVDPYVDAMTGSVTITLAKTLCDAKSVVAIDMTVDRLQSITEETAAESASYAEIVLTGRYRVIAHSDRAEVGKDYFERNDSFGSKIVEQLRTQDAEETYFSLSFGESEYIVYAITIESDWLCLSVIDATEAFRGMRNPLILTVLIALCVIAIFLALMIRSRKQDEMVDHMKELADCDQLTGLRNRRAYVAKLELLSYDPPTDGIVVMLDVNGLKKTNDTCGHNAGDELLAAAADCIREAFEGVDDIFRIGGDEFCVITEGTEEDTIGLLEAMDRRTAVWNGKYIHGFTVSYGTAAIDGRTDLEAVAKEADQKMYDNKNRFYKHAENDRRHSPENDQAESENK